jgi:YD repeat-containing protein
VSKAKITAEIRLLERKGRVLWSYKHIVLDHPRRQIFLEHIRQAIRDPDGKVVEIIQADGRGERYKWFGEDILATFNKDENGKVVFFISAADRDTTGD